MTRCDYLRGSDCTPRSVTFVATEGATQALARIRDISLTLHHTPLLFARESSIVRAEIEALCYLELVYERAILF